MRSGFRLVVSVALLLSARHAFSQDPDAATLPAFLPSGQLSDAELAQHWSPNPELAERLRHVVRLRSDESLEIRSFGDDEIHRIVGGRTPPTPATGPVTRSGGVPIAGPPADGIHGLNVARSGLNEIRQCVNGSHSPAP